MSGDLARENERLRREIDHLRARLGEPPEVKPATEDDGPSGPVHVLLGAPVGQGAELVLFDYVKRVIPDADWRLERDLKRVPVGAIVFCLGDVAECGFGGPTPPRYVAVDNAGDTRLERVPDGDLGDRVMERARALVDRMTWHIERIEDLGNCAASSWHAVAFDVVQAHFNLVRTTYNAGKNDECRSSIDKPRPEEPEWAGEQLAVRG